MKLLMVTNNNVFNKAMLIGVSILTLCSCTIFTNSTKIGDTKVFVRGNDIVATNFPYMQKQFIDMIRKNSKAIISIDTHEAYMEEEAEFIKEIFDSVDIAFIDKEYIQLLDCKAPVKIIKMGKKGCKYQYKDKCFIAETEERKVIDKTGAGDVVTGVFLSMMSKTQDPVQSLKTAVNVATKSIGDYGVDFLINREVER